MQQTKDCKAFLDEDLDVLAAKALSSASKVSA